MAVYLRVLHGSGAGQVLPVPENQRITIGRSSAASYNFDDPLLSRRHCVIECAGQACRIADLKSRNGTFVNGQRITTSHLSQGDRVRIGNILMEVTFATGAQPQPATASAGGTVTLCEGCRCQLQPGETRQVRGRLLCLKCAERFDVEEDMIEGFKVHERLSARGIGTAYKATQLLMGRFVVLKTIPTSGVADQKEVRRFMREAKAGGRLNHPNIVEVFDVNQTNEMLYIVMEWVEGYSLAAALRARGRIDPREAHHHMTHIAAALSYAHQNSIVHRDVKPANVLIRSSDHHTKLSDFSLAKNLERAGLSVITADGEAIGTPYYMPPEQVRSAKAADARSDIYSFGATFYHALTGGFPIEARSYGEFIAKVFGEEPVPISKRAPDVPAELAAVVEKAMMKESKQRYQSAEEMLQALKALRFS